MAKAPAFQFYYDRFNSSTSLWDDAQVGKYVRLMICQANKGFVTDRELAKVASGDEDVMSKFVKISDGKFANEVLSEILAARDKYSENRANNRKSGHYKKKEESYENHMKIIDSSQKNHMVDVDVVVDKEGSKKQKGGAGEKQKTEKELAAIRVMEYFNQATNRKLDVNSRSYLSNILARFKEGRTEQGLCDIVDLKIVEWTGREQEKYLHPDTLFAAKHSQTYHDQVEYAKSGRLTKNQIKGTNGGKTKPTMEGILNIIYKNQPVQ